MREPVRTDDRRRWNHNIHYHGILLDAPPRTCERVLDVGCGEGTLTPELRKRAATVVAIDRDQQCIALARQRDPQHAEDYIVGDFLAYDFDPESFDAIVSVAALHHMGTAIALARMRELVRPGGSVAIVGLARSHSFTDLAFDVAGAVATRAHKLTKGSWESAAPKVWPPPETYRETRRIAMDVLPGVRYRRHVLYRYSLVWTKPTH